MPERNHRVKIILAFITLYLVWGSTYLAIRIGVDTLPPAMFAAIRWLIAGTAFALYARAVGQPWPRGWHEWSTIVVVSLCLIVGGNGLVVWAEQWVPSNLAALIIAGSALWISAFGTLGKHGEAIGTQTKWGLGIGFAGVGLLLWPDPATFSRAHVVGEIVVSLASVLWAAGTIYARRNKTRTLVIMATAMQSLIGGGVLLSAGLVLQEPARWEWSPAGLGALAYLTVLGSLGYFTYTWLTHETTPAKLGTYAYVNPAVAVLLGWWVLDETLSARALTGMGVVIAGVVLVTTAAAPRAR